MIAWVTKYKPLYNKTNPRLREASNFSDGDYGAGEIHVYARACMSPAPQSLKSDKVQSESLLITGSW